MKIKFNKLTALLLCAIMIFGAVGNVVADDVSQDEGTTITDEIAETNDSESEESSETEEGNDSDQDEEESIDPSVDTGDNDEEITVNEVGQEDGLEAEEDLEEEISDNMQALEARTTSSSGSITIDIPEYDETAGWENGAAKDVTITVDFGDATSTDKEVSIILPEGLKFKEFPVATIDSSETSASLQVETSGVFSQFLTAVTSYPITQAYYPSFNGKLSYTFLESTEKVTFTVKVAVDEAVYYGEKMFNGIVEDKDGNLEAIVVNASKNGSPLDDAMQTVYATHSVTTGLRLYSDHYPQTMVQGSSDPFYLTTMSSIYYGTGEYLPKYYKNYKLIYYYLPELTYYSTSFTGTYLNGGTPEVIDNSASNYLELTASNIYATSKTMGSWNFYFTASDAAVGTYTKTYTQEIELVAYDNTVINKEYITYSHSSQVPGNPGGTQLANDLTNQRVTRNVTEKLDVITNSLNAVSLGTVGRYYADGVITDYQVTVPIRITSDNTTEKTNQWIEVEVPADFQATQVILPVNSTELQTNYRLYYETSSNTSGWLTSSSQIQTITSGKFVGVTQSSLGLGAGEYITYVKAFVGDYSKGYESSSSLGYALTSNNGVVLGSLATGTNSATITMRMYALDPDFYTEDNEWVADNAEPGSETGNITATVTRLSGKGSVAAGPLASSASMTAGETKTVTFKLINSHYYYQNTIGVYSPNFYFRNIDGVNIESVTASDTLGQTITFDSTDIAQNTYTTSQGETVTKLYLEGLLSGAYFSEKTSSITVSVTLRADITASGNYNWMNYVFWDVDGVTTYSTRYGYGPVVKDTYDVNNNGSTSDSLWASSSYELNITAQKTLIIDTYIVPEGESRRPAYDGTDDTVVGFTPGSTATYTVDMANNMDSAVEELTLYIPVPKTGTNYGTDLQDTAFYWDMALTAIPTITSLDASKYIIEYTDETTNNYASATYSTTPSNLAEVTMIRVTLDSGESIASGETATITISYEIAETNPDSSKLEMVNTFRPYYYIKSSTSGWLQGTLVGAKLVNGVISGTVFMDNDGDGLYDVGTDTLLSTTASEEVKLYKLNTTTNLYELEDTTTVTNGVYEFTSLANGKYKLDFNDFTTSTNPYFTKRSALNATDGSHVYQLTADGEIGTRSNIDPTATTSQTINAGILNYNPATDLQVTLSPTTATVYIANNLGDGATTATGTLTISSDVYATVQPSTNAVVWSYSTAIARVSSGTLTSNAFAGTTQATYTVTGDAVGTTTATVTVTDIFGNTATATIDIKVLQAGNVYTVSYDDNGGRGDGPADESVAAGSSHTLNSTTIPTHGQNNDKDVVFIGWSEDEDNYTYSAGETLATAIVTNITVNNDTTVYAVWGYDTNGNGKPDINEPLYDVVYDTNTGNGDGPATVSGLLSQSGYVLDDTTIPTHAQDSGVDVVFIGWSKAKLSTIYSKNDTAPATITTVDISDNTTTDGVLAVYAVWGYDTNRNGIPDIAEAYTLTVLAERGGSVITTVVGKYLKGEEITITASANSGYKFSNWTSNNSGTFANATSSTTTFTMPAGNVTVTANFTATGGDGNGGNNNNNDNSGSDNDDEDNSSTTSNDNSSDTSLTEIELDADETPLSNLLITDGHIPYISGYEDGTVKADNNITRAEAAQIFYNLLITKGTSDDAHFSDVADGAWYAQAVNYLASIGILSGYTDGTFRPEESITRAEFATMASKFDSLSESDANVFSDVPDTHWAVSYINSAYVKGWVSGYPDGTFHPDGNITRAEVVTIVNAMLDRSADTNALETVENPYTDLSSSHWAYAEIIEASISHEYTRNGDGNEIWQSVE